MPFPQKPCPSHPLKVVPFTANLFFCSISLTTTISKDKHHEIFLELRYLQGVMFFVQPLFLTHYITFIRPLIFCYVCRLSPMFPFLALLSGL